MVLSMADSLRSYLRTVSYQSTTFLPTFYQVDPLGRYVASDTTAALKRALVAVTYVNLYADPDDETRQITFTATDLSGQTSRPCVAFLAIAAVNNKPVVNLAGPGKGTTGYSINLTEVERVLSIPICEQGASVTDADGKVGRVTNALALDAPAVFTEELRPSALQVMARMMLQISGAVDGLGVAETLDADTTGTSIVKSFSTSTGLLLLNGLDTPANYQRVLLSARYRNRGVLVKFPDFVPPTSLLQFTEGPRTISVTAVDTYGGTGNATTVVNVQPNRRVGDPKRDGTIMAPPACSGHGTFENLPYEGTSGGPRCVCDPQYEGDLCEIPPCMAHGIYQARQHAPSPSHQPRLGPRPVCAAVFLVIHPDSFECPTYGRRRQGSAAASEASAAQTAPSPARGAAPCRRMSTETSTALACPPILATIAL